jgi:hypothetical protein
VSYVFISHVEEDASIASEIAGGLEAAGFTAWYYERDSVPGPSYLSQILDAIKNSAAVIVIISPDALGSWQVDKEVIQVHESGIPFIPLLKGLTHAEFRSRNPEWAMAMGASTSTVIPPEGAGSIVPRIVAGLQRVGVPSTQAASGAGAAPAISPARYPGSETSQVQTDTPPAESRPQVVSPGAHAEPVTVVQPDPGALPSLTQASTQRAAGWRPNRTLLIAGGGALAVIIILVVVLSLALKGGGSKASATPTVVALGPMLLQDSMSDPSHGVLDKSSSDPTNTFKGYTNGHYAIKIVNPQFNLIATEYLGTLGNQADTTMQIDARVAGTTAGRTVDLACRSSTVGSDDRSYRLYVHPDTRKYQLVAFYNHRDHNLIPLTSLSAINTGTSWNHLQLSCIGNQISGAINGSAIPTQTDTSLRKGELWLGMEVDPGPDVGEADYRNLVVYQRRAPAFSPNLALGSVLAQDKLDNPATGILDKSSTDPKDTYYGYHGGHYVIQITNPTYNFVATEHITKIGNQANTTMAVEARVAGPTSGATIDLACRRTTLSNAEADYRLYVHPDTGTYHLVVFYNHRDHDIIPSTPLSAINRGTAWNYLELTCAGKQISGDINGARIPAHTDTTIKSGDLWFGVEHDPSANVVDGQFQNLLVYRR